MQDEALKLKLIQKIMDMPASYLRKLEHIIESENGGQKKDIKDYVRPIRKKTDIEEIKKERNWKPIDREAFFEKLESLNQEIEEPLEDLLKMI